jgi:hypothetical protein
VPGHDLLTDALAGCQSQLRAERAERPTLPSCYDFEDAAPTYDRKFGAAGDTSPEIAARIAHLTADECGAIMEWSTSADFKRETCLKGKVPKGWKERYGSPIEDRPLMKACRATFSWPDLSNAHDRYQEQRIREWGGVVRRTERMTPDGSHVFYSSPDGGDVGDPEPGVH